MIFLQAASLHVVSRSSARHVHYVLYKYNTYDSCIHTYLKHMYVFIYIGMYILSYIIYVCNVASENPRGLSEYVCTTVSVRARHASLASFYIDDLIILPSQNKKKKKKKKKKYITLCIIC